MYLTQEQHNFFDAFGYLAFAGLFAAEEIAWIAAEFEQVLDTFGAGDQHDGSRRTMIVPTIDHSERLCTLLDDARILGIAGDLLGDDFNYASGEGNYYSGDTGWHPDGNYPELFAIKVAFYLDPVDQDSGCLRVIAGSHRNPFHDKLWSLHLDIPDRARALDHVAPRLLEMWERDTGGSDGGERLLTDPRVNHLGLAPENVPSVALESQPGDAVFFSHQLWHAAFGGRAGRRMFTLNYMAA